MKHTMTPLEGCNEPLDFAKLIFGNYFFETNLRCYQTQPSLIPPYTQLELLPHSPTGANETSCIDVHNSSNSSIGSSSIAHNVWTLYFDGSKMQDGSTEGCVLTYPHNKKHILSCHLEFEYTNNTTEYEALILELKKSIH